MASTPMVNIHEITVITPPSDSPKSANQISFPLTFFDIIWFKFPPVDDVFFYQLTGAASTPSYFYSEILPRLKQSLSLALLYYLPLAGKLNWPADSPKPIISYTPNDGVSLTVAESKANNFDTLSSNEIYKANELHPLVPELMISEDVAAMISLQVTLFPSQGFSIGYRVHRSVVDGRSMYSFIKSWGRLSKQLGGNYKTELPSLPPHLIPFLDRNIIKDPTGLDLLYLNRWLDALGENQASSRRNLKTLHNIVTTSDDIVRTTIEFVPEDINKLRDKALSSARKPLHLSTFVLTLAYTSTCLVKAKGGEGNRVVSIGFSVDWRTRLRPPLPIAYFGNCVMSSRSSAKATSFMGENGFAFAVNMISDLVNKLNDGILEGAENELLNLPSMIKRDQEIQTISVAGSPRLDVYGSDFGLGRLKKVEFAAIDRTGAISMTERRHGTGGVEVGLALKKHEMGNFIASLISDGLCNVDCRTRLKPPLPTTYIGNCIMVFKSSAKATNFMDENGYSFAVNMISDFINQVNKGVLEGSENQLSSLPSISKREPGTLHISVFGSPQLQIYGSDFGLGRLKKVEFVSIDHTNGAISMTERRDGSRGVEVGLALKKSEMEKFIASFNSDGFEKHLRYALVDGREEKAKERRRNLQEPSPAYSKL